MQSLWTVLAPYCPNYQLQIMLSIDQKEKLRLIKGLTKVLADFVSVIEEGDDKETNIQDAIKAVDYYQRKLK